jgi:hypothetical protein
MHPAAFHRRTEVPALGTDWTLRPAHSFEMRQTGVVIGKLLEKGHDRHARQPTERSPRRLKDFAVASWLRHSSIRTPAASTVVGSQALALTFFGSPVMKISPSAGKRPSPAQRFDSVSEQPSVAHTLPDVRALDFRIPVRRALAASSLASARSRARHVSMRGFARSSVCFDQRRSPGRRSNLPRHPPIRLHPL